tara:strand:- start:621 stop:818 length:198 start_codon:yes stop_codon:yes gene_type:complete
MVLFIHRVIKLVPYTIAIVRGIISWERLETTKPNDMDEAHRKKHGDADEADRERHGDAVAVFLVA